jgi:predicted house-cleaning noncanonical NTP pyrophosphatase (MazG superfamily)
MIKTYNKLVRDRIPEIIEESGARCKIEVLNDSDYLKMIDKKMDEELEEYHEDHSIEELADLIEVIHSAALARGYTLDELEAVRIKKREARGGFDKKILLIETERK